MKSPRIRGFRYLCLLAALSTCPVHSNTFTVTRTNTSGPGSLPVIINQANATPGDQTIEFAVSGTITLVSPLPTITNNLTISGRLDSPVTVSGGGTVPIFTLAAGTTNFLNQITLADGKTGTGGAAINNAGTLFVTGCQFTNNVAQNGSGGAISNAGTMTIVSSTLSGNQALNGGAIHNAGTMSITSSALASNHAGNGGGISSSGTMTVTDSRLLSNEGSYGGAVYNSGTLTIERLIISSNQALLGLGGGIFNAGNTRIVATTFSFNSGLGEAGSAGAGGGGGAGFGGGLYSRDGSVSIINSTFSRNTVVGGKGGAGSPSSRPGGDDSGRGGRGGGQDGGQGGVASLATPILPGQGARRIFFWRWWFGGELVLRCATW